MQHIVKLNMNWVTICQCIDSQIISFRLVGIDLLVCFKLDAVHSYKCKYDLCSSLWLSADKCRQLIRTMLAFGTQYFHIIYFGRRLSRFSFVAICFASVLFCRRLDGCCTELSSVTVSLAKAAQITFIGYLLFPLCGYEQTKHNSPRFHWLHLTLVKIQKETSLLKKKWFFS